MIKFYFNNIKNYFQILEQDEKAVRNLPFKSEKGIEIMSVNCPAFYSCGKLYIRGNSRHRDLDKIKYYNEHLLHDRIIPSILELWGNDECKIRIQLK